MQHLVQHSGSAIIVYPEMSEFLDLVLKKQNDLLRERQLYCELFDGLKWTDTRIGKESNTVEVDNLCFCWWICAAISLSGPTDDPRQQKPWVS